MKDHEIRELVNQLRDIAVKYHAAGQLREQIARVIRSAMLQTGNSPVIPDGYVMVPKEPTEDMCFAPDARVGNKTWDGYQSSADMAECKAIYEAMLAAAPQEVK